MPGVGGQTRSGGAAPPLYNWGRGLLLLRVLLASNKTRPDRKSF